MTTDPDRALRTLILELTLEVKELRMQVNRMEQDSHRRHAALIEWSARQSFDDEIESIDGVGFDETKTPGDVASALNEWMKRGR